jgi:anti-anti-sigma factor
MEALDECPEGAVAVVQLAGELDAADTDWADQIETAFATGKRCLVIDLLNVTFIDSSVVRTLILAQRRAGEHGWVRVVYTHHLIARVIGICGLSDAFPQFTTVDAALRSAPSKLASLRAVVSADEQARADAAREDVLGVGPAGEDDDDHR